MGSIDGVQTLLRVLCKQKNGLTISYINAQRLTNKIDEFRYIFEQSNVDIICVSETWYKPSTTNNIITMHDYNVIRNDRSTIGGGVAIYIKKSFSFNVVYKSSPNDAVESLFIEIAINSHKILVGCVYRPNKNISPEALVTTLTEITVNYDEIIIAGDLNSNVLCDTRLTETFESIGLHTVNMTIPTHFTSSSQSLLDIFLIDSLTKMLLYEQLSVSCFSRHDSIFMIYESRRPLEDEQQKFYNFSKTNFIKLSQELENINWDSIFYIPSAEDQLIFLNQNFEYLLNSAVPLQLPRKKRPDRSWFNSSIATLIKRRDTAYKRWKRFRTSQLYEDFRVLRTEVNKTIKRTKSLYYENKFRTSLDSKMKWKAIKEIGLGKTMDRNVSENPDDINQKFVRITNNAFLTSPQFTTPILHPERIFPPFSSFEFSCINSDDVSKSCSMVKAIVRHITQLFNTIITTGNYPMGWKHAKVIPIPKSNANNEYRPISILPYLSKVFERIIHFQITEYLRRNSLLSVHQSGFRSKHSCITALLDVTENIRVSTDKGLLSLLVLLDHSKAFDCVNHDILCFKLERYFNFSNSAVKLISNYLRYRIQSVVIKNKSSTPLNLIAGVPQGSILGPLLFCMYINDLPNILDHSKIHIYADDVQIYLSCQKSQIADGVNKLNYDLGKIYLWAQNNCLQINPKKSKCLLINGRAQNISCEYAVQIGSEQIEQTHKTKNLGIIFNSSLTWNDHIIAATGKMFGMLRTLYQTQHLTPLNIRILLAKSYLIPVVLYGSELFTKTDVNSKNRLESAYKAILRYIYRLKRFESCSAFRKSLHGVDIGDYLNIKALIMMHKLIYTKTPGYLHMKLQFGRSSRRILIVANRNQLLLSEWTIGNIFDETLELNESYEEISPLDDYDKSMSNDEDYKSPQQKRKREDDFPSI
ncbi:uncharacterized protein LOC142224667 [Haematobia irritans]|uniref:uncharacterized protein LOC142224667 n=1 Tax=Haematobia irritans TaxID=7368 RepID=UPI003F500197